MEYDVLIQNIACEDMESLRLLYEDMYSPVFAYILSIVKNASLAADLTQDTFVRVYQQSGRFKPRGQGRAWVLRIARNLAINELRRQKRESLSEMSDELRDYGNPYGRSEAMLTLKSLFMVLSVREREIVMLKSSGYTHKEIASIVKLPEGTVRWKYTNAMKKLQSETDTKEMVNI